jgi:hypothetical protein
LDCWRNSAIELTERVVSAMACYRHLTTSQLAAEENLDKTETRSRLSFA